MRLLILSFLLYSTPSYSNLKAPIDLPSAALMPKNIRNMSFKQVFAEAKTKFSNSGDDVLVSTPLFTDVTFDSIAVTKIDPAERAAIYQILDSIGVDKDTVVAQTTGQVNIKANATVPVLAYGINQRLTIAVAVPIIQYSTNVDSSVNHKNTQDFLNFRQKLIDKGVTDKAAEAYAKIRTDPVGSKLEEYGYLPLKNESGTLLGDIKIVSKYKVQQTEKNLWTIQGEVTLPTGKEAHIDKVVDVPGGDGQTDLGLYLLNDFTINQYFTLSSKIGHTFQLRDTTAKRIPEIRTSTLSPDKDYNTKRDLGDKSTIELAIKYTYNGFGISTGHSFQYKLADKYSGGEYSLERYDWLEIATVQNMYTAQLKISYDTISLFRQKKFPAPILIDINHSRVLAGKNVVNDPLTSLNFSLFF